MWLTGAGGRCAGPQLAGSAVSPAGALLPPTHAWQLQANAGDQWQQGRWWQGQMQQPLLHPALMAHPHMPQQYQQQYQHHYQRHGDGSCMSLPGAGGVMYQQAVSTPAASGGLYGQHAPPLTAPTGMGSVPGTPLLPILHYQQTVMRHRTASSTSHDAGCSTGYMQQQHPGAQFDALAYGSSNGGRSNSESAGSRWGSAGSGSSGSRSARPQAVEYRGPEGGVGKVAHDAPNVWPPRGVERSAQGGAQGAGRAGAGSGGDIVVYNAHLLLS